MAIVGSAVTQVFLAPAATQESQLLQVTQDSPATRECQATAASPGPQGIRGSAATPG